MRETKNKKNEEWHLPFLPLPPIVLFALLLNLNDRAYITPSQHILSVAVTLILCGGIYGLMRVLIRRSECVKSLTKTHGTYIMIFFLLLLWRLHGIVSNHFFMWIESFSINDYMFMKYSITRYQQLPLWNTYVWSGSPSHAIGDKWLFYPFVFPFFLLPLVLAMNMLVMGNIALAGLLMYGLIFHLTKSKKAGLVSALVFAFSAWFMSKGQCMFFWHTFPMSLVPAIFLCLVLLTRQKTLSGFLKKGAAAGILLGLQVISGTPEYFLYTSYFVMGIYLAVSVLTSQRLRKRLPFLIAAGLVIVGLCLSISAVKLLPANQFMKMTNRGGEWSGAEHPTTLRWGTPLNIFRFLARSSWTKLANYGLGGKTYVDNAVIYMNEEVCEIGLSGFLLALLALLKFRKRYVLALGATALTAVLMLNIPFYNLVRSTLPMLSRFHVQGRILMLFVFAGAGLAGIGWTVLSTKIPKNWVNRAFIILVALIVVDLIILGHPPAKLQAGNDMLKGNHIMQSLSEREGLFRIASFDVPGIDWAIHPVTIPLEIQYNQGLDGLIWINDYMEYIMIAHSYPSRLLGILNVKYGTSSALIEREGYSLEQSFEECGICDYPPGAMHYDGPHLYVNDNVLPRAYTIENAILVTGELDNVKNIVYGILVHPDFNPRTTAVIHDPRSLSEMSQSALSAYKVVIPITLSNNADFSILASMKESGVRILPDILEGENQIDTAELEDILREMNGNVTTIQEVDVSHYTPNNVEVGPVTTGNFLILAEKYSMFPGWWKASTESNDVNMLRANAVGTAIPVSEIYSDTVTFRYLPPPFVIGSILSLTGILIGIVLIWQPWRKKPEEKNKKAKKKK